MHSDSANEIFFNEFLLSARYNNIKTIEEQCYDVDRSTLRSLAKLFVDHNVDKDFGICLLHRHQSLPSDRVMVHSRPHPGRDVCHIEPLGSRPHYPFAFYVDEKTQFVPYEFSSTPQEVPRTNFLAALLSFFLESGLEEKLALCCVAHSERPWVEFIAADGQGTIASQVSMKSEFVEADGVVTEWIFIRESDTIEIREHKKCVRPEGGGHKKERFE